MDVTFVLSREDALAYYQDFASNKKLSKKGSRLSLEHVAYYLAFYSVPLVTFLVSLAFLHNFGNAVVICIVFAYLWRWPFYRLWQRSWLARASQSTELSGQHTISITPLGVCDRTQGYEYTMYWPVITEILMTDRNILFFCRKGTLTPLPRRAFADSQVAEQYHQQALVLWKSSVWPPPPMVEV